ncbi:MAG: nucleoside triphosphate pyrophosphohydrolase [Candidatus Acidiferrales bacterium]
MGRPKARAKIASSHSAGKIRKARAKSKIRPRAGELFEALVALQARLRAPGGCPWDREQTHESLRTYLVEETYEVLDALDTGHGDKIAEELGDLLLQIVFHAELGRESGSFDIAELIERVHAKMVRRHPHVFGDVRARTSGEVLKKWEQLKAEERREERDAESELGHETASSILDGVSTGLPALIEAQQLTRRAANVGFDWPRVEGILEKLAEETTELRAALSSPDMARRSHETEDEVGDLLFVVVNLARFLGLDSELALKRASRKFKARFQMMEEFARETGRPLADFSADDLEALWERAKARGARGAVSA